LTIEQLISAGQLADGAHLDAFVSAIRSGSSDWFEAVPGERMRILSGRAQNGGAFTLVESIAAPGAAPPLHAHATADEIFFVLEGSLHFQCGGHCFTAAAGSIIHIPKYAHHGWLNSSQREARMLAFFTPGGIEDMFTALPATPPEAIVDLAARYDTFVVGPPVAKAG